MINSVTLLGSSSGRNAGDAALMSGIMDAVDGCTGRRLLYEIPTIKPSFVRENYSHNVRPVSLMPWNLSIKMLGLPTYHSVMRTDISLIFDAILFDRALYNPLFNFLSTLYLILPRAKKLGKLMGFYNVGAGPVSTAAGRKMLRVLADTMDFITVRDRDSYDLLADLGVNSDRMLLTADAALNADGADRARAQQILGVLGFEVGKEIFAININAYLDTWASPNRRSMGKEHFLRTFSAALNRVNGELNVPLLFVSTQHHDLEITRELMSMVQPTTKMAVIDNMTFSHTDIKGVLREVALLFGMRLHAMILASSELTPIVGLAYQPKVDYYYRSLGLPGFSMSFDDFSEQTLVTHMLNGWEKRAMIRQTLERVIPKLKQEAHYAAEVVTRMGRGEDPLKVMKELAHQGAPKEARTGVAS